MLVFACLSFRGLITVPRKERPSPGLGSVLVGVWDEGRAGEVFSLLPTITPRNTHLIVFCLVLEEGGLGWG